MFTYESCLMYFTRIGVRGSGGRPLAAPIPTAARPRLANCAICRRWGRHVSASRKYHRKVPLGLDDHSESGVCSIACRGLSRLSGHTYAQHHISACIHTNVHACIHAFRPIHTYVHTRTHTSAAYMHGIASPPADEYIHTLIES